MYGHGLRCSFGVCWDLGMLSDRYELAPSGTLRACRCRNHEDTFGVPLRFDVERSARIQTRFQLVSIGSRTYLDHSAGSRLSSPNCRVDNRRYPPAVSSVATGAARIPTYAPRRKRSCSLISPYAGQSCAELRRGW